MTSFIAVTSRTLAIGCAAALATACVPPMNQSGPPDARQQTPIDASRSSDADDASTCTVQPCDILPQCGCAAGQTCDVDSVDLMGTACRAVAMMGQEGAACSQSVDCDTGHTCLSDYTGTVTSCHKFCSGNADCTAPRGQCVIEMTADGTNSIPGIPKMCSSNCDPVSTAASACPAAGQKCGLVSYVLQGVSYPTVDCIAAGSGTQGANCKTGGAANEASCAQGYNCTTFNNGQTYTCHRLCNKNNPGGVCGGKTCTSFAPAYVINGVEYGICN